MFINATFNGFDHKIDRFLIICRLTLPNGEITHLIFYSWLISNLFYLFFHFSVSSSWLVVLNFSYLSRYTFLMFCLFENVNLEPAIFQCMQILFYSGNEKKRMGRRRHRRCPKKSPKRSFIIQQRTTISSLDVSTFSSDILCYIQHSMNKSEYKMILLDFKNYNALTGAFFLLCRDLWRLWVGVGEGRNPFHVLMLEITWETWRNRTTRSKAEQS